MSIQQDVTAFMFRANQGVPKTPIIPNVATRKLRAKLILEEALEQCAALGIIVVIPCLEATLYRPGDVLVIKESDIALIPWGEPSLTEIADSTADQAYVSEGTAIACGIDMEPIHKIVHESNMAKFGPGSYRRSDGKQMKPEGWQPPTQAINEEIKRQQKLS